MTSELIKNIRLKLLLLYLVPSLSLFLLLIGHTYVKFESYRQISGIERTVGFIDRASELIRTLQLERGTSVLYRASRGKKEIRQQLLHQREETDRSLERFNGFLLKEPGLKNTRELKKILQGLDHLFEYRQSVDQRSLSVLRILDDYSRLIESLIRGMMKYTQDTIDPQLHRKGTDLIAILRLSEIAGQQRALVSTLLLDEGLASVPLQERLKILRIKSRQLRAYFFDEADLYDLQLYRQTMDPRLDRWIRETAQRLIERNSVHPLDVRTWWKRSTRQIDTLFRVEKGILQKIQSIKNTRLNEATRTLVTSVLFWGFFLLLLYLLFRSILRIIRDFGQRYEENRAKQKLAEALHTFDPDLLEECEGEELIESFTKTLYRTGFFERIWLLTPEKEGVFRPSSSEGVPLAKIGREFETMTRHSADFLHALLETCATRQAQRYRPGEKERSFFGPKAECVGIVPLHRSRSCDSLLILTPLPGQPCDREVLVLVQHYTALLGKSIERNEILRKLRRSEESLRVAAAAFNAQEAITITNAQGEILEVNDAFTRITGYTPEEVIGKNPNILQSGKHDKAFYTVMWDRIRKEGYWKGEIYNRKKNGEIYPEMLSISAVRDDKDRITHYVAHFFDITEVKQAQEAAEYRALHDPLTDLYNRQKLIEELRRIYLRSQRSGESNIFFYFDIDNFKQINDSYSHETGDQVLIEVGRKLRSLLREGDLLARIAGDEFALILTDLGPDRHSATAKATIVLERIQTLFREPIHVGEIPIEVSFSIGVKLFPDREKDWKEVMVNADVAMYHAKRNGKNRYYFFDSKIDDESKKFLRLKHDFVRALKKGELLLHYQPRIELGSNRIVGMEALIRWQTPEGRLLLPGDFLHVTQGNPLGYELTEWILSGSFRQIAAWKKRYPGFDLHLSINLSGDQFNSGTYMHRLMEYCARQPESLRRHLEFEIVEDVMARNIDYTAATIQVFRELGIGFSIDDFGTGYSSINYLKRLPVDLLKIDKEFLLDLFDNQNEEIVKLIVETAHIFGVKAVAEGVESLEVLHFLEGVGCDYAQGFLFAKPLPLRILEEEWIAPLYDTEEAESTPS